MHNGIDYNMLPGSVVKKIDFVRETAEQTAPDTVLDWAEARWVFQNRRDGVFDRVTEVAA